MRELAREVLAIAEAGLKARARPGAGGMIADETHFLNALHEIVASGQTPADELLARYAATGTATSTASTPTTATEPGAAPRRPSF